MSEPDTPTLTAAQTDALYEALDANLDGDFLVGADGYGEDIDIQHAGAGDVTRWAVDAVIPLVAGWLAEARAEAWDEGYEAGVEDEATGMGGSIQANPYREATP